MEIKNAKKRESKFSKERLKQMQKLKQKRKKKLIIRNLSFKVNEDGLKSIFSKFGTVVDVVIPLKSDGKKRGFAFIQFENMSSVVKAMKAMNYKEIEGRKIAIDYAIDKTSYQVKMQNIKKESEDIKTEEEIKNESESDADSSEDEEIAEKKFRGEKMDDKEMKANQFLKEFDALSDNDNDQESSDDFSSDESSDDDEENDEKPSRHKIKEEIKSESSSSSPKKTRERPEDVSEGKTVFLRNISFLSTEESLSESMREFGDFYYCVLCIDKVTGHSKGSAFVKFKEKSSADTLIEKSSQEPGIFVDGRKVNCTPAISRDEVSKISNQQKKPKSKRNLDLLKVGVVQNDSKESEGVSQSDMSKRMQLDRVKRQKLKNVNFFVSDKRLMISNLPRIYTDKQLRLLFQNAAGKGAVITQAKVMQEFKKLNPEGKPFSKGFGFVSFSNHEDALKALTELNNNPNTFSASKRPIVEFSVENTMALLTQQRRKEKFLNKLKNTGGEKQFKHSKTEQQNPDGKQISTQKKSKRKRKFGKEEKGVVNEQCNIGEEDSSSKQKKKRKKQKQRKQKSPQKNADRMNMGKVSVLANKYKEKLINKFS